MFLRASQLLSDPSHIYLLFFHILLLKTQMNMHVIWRVGHATYFEIAPQSRQTGGQVNILVDIFSLSIMREKAICLCIYSSMTDLAHTINLEVQAMFVIPLLCL